MDRRGKLGPLWLQTNSARYASQSLHEMFVILRQGEVLQQTDPLHNIAFS